MTDRVFNFNPGPATLPYQVLEQAAKDIVNYRGVGMGLIELSHRSNEFMAIAEQTESLLRKLMQIPDNYKVLFLQGGASSQFYMVPMNFLGGNKKATYLNTGTWSKKAIKEAERFGNVDVAFSSEPDNFKRVPTQDEYQISDKSEYVYLVSNNTIFGTQYKKFPETKKTLICDMSSDILSKKIDVEKFGMIFAGAQKNLGPSGVTVAIVKDELLDSASEDIPTMLRYKTHADKGSMFNTPPCFPIYVVGEVLKWLDNLGGIDEIEKINREKAAILYDAIDRSDYYKGHAEIDSRSDMNVPFNLPNAELETKFISEAADAELKGLKGHRSIGGCRASIYNAFPMEGVKQLSDFMKKFEADNPA